MTNKQSTKNFCGIRVKRDTKKKIESLLSTANKKSLGRKIKVDELLQLALSIVENSHIEQLQSASLSNEDRKEKLRQIYVKTRGQITKDEFTGFMMSSEFVEFLNENKELLSAA